MRAVGFRCNLDILKAYEDEGRWIVEGYAATTDFDLQGDIITQQAIETSAGDLLENSTVLMNHDPNMAIGKVESSEARKGGLFLKIFISSTVPEIWQRIKEGVLNKFSIRGRILQARKHWVEVLAKFAWLIFKMQLVEVSLVAVPANPKARAVRWYIEKALSDYEEKGGRVEEITESDFEKAIRKGGTDMAEQVEDVEILEGVGDPKPGREETAKGFPSPGRLNDEWTGYLKEKGLGEGKDLWEPWLAFCKQQGYPAPYPYPYPKPASNKTLDQVISILDQLIGNEDDEETLGLLQQAKALLDRLRGGAYPYPAPPASKGETEEGDGDEMEKAGRKLNAKRLARFKKLMEDLLQRFIGEVETATGLSGGRPPARGAEVEKDSKEIKDTVADLAKVLGIPRETGGQPEAGGLLAAVTALKTRLDGLESLPADKTSLDGQETLPGEKGGGKKLWKGLV